MVTDVNMIASAEIQICPNVLRRDPTDVVKRKDWSDSLSPLILRAHVLIFP